MLAAGPAATRAGSVSAAAGYRAHLVDPVPKLVEQARAAASAQPDYVRGGEIERSLTVR